MVKPRRSARLAAHAVLMIATALLVMPVLYAFIKATQTQSQALSPSLIPGAELWTNVALVWTRFDLGRLMFNTLFVAIAVTVGKTILAITAASALVFHRFPLKGPIFLIILFTLMMPTEVMIIALYDLVVGLGLFNTYTALILPFLASATGVFLFRQHFLRVPSDLVEAAQLDGAGPLRFLRSIIIPISWNTIGAMAVIQFVYVWNAYLWPLLLIQDTERQVVQVGLSRLLVGQDTNHYGIVMAGVILTMIPTLAVFMALQEQFTRGFALSSDK